jgi:hypothetical protein
MSCSLHRVFAQGDNRAFEAAVRAATFDDLEGMAVPEHGEGECTFCDTIRAERWRRWEAND